MDNIDYLAKNIFKRLFKRNDAVPVEVLICPLCRDKLESLVIDSSNNGVKEETVWWTCRGVNMKSCDFPLAMPPDVFWVTRTAEQIMAGIIPYPRLDLLPAEYHHLYPSIFKDRPVFAPPPKPPAITTDSSKKSRVPKIHQRERGLAAFDIDITKRSYAPRSRDIPIAQSARQSEEIARQLQKIEFGDASSIRKVNLFPDSRVALDTLISLKFSGESFLNGLNSAMCQKQLVQPHPAIHHRQRMDIMRNEDDQIIGNALNEQSAHSSKTRFLAPPKNKMTAAEKKEISDRLSLLVTRIPMELADQSLQIRLGKRIRADPSTTAQNDLNWNEMGLGVPKADDPKSLRKLCCPPPSSLSSGELSSQSESLGPKIPVIPIKSIGDEELDNLIRSNLNNLLRSGTLRRRKKRKPNAKPKKTESADKLEAPHQTTADNSFMHEVSETMPFLPDDNAFYDEHRTPGILDDDFFGDFGNPHDY